MTAEAEKIGIVYDQDYLVHTQKGHPECRERLEHIFSALQKEELKNKLQFEKPFPASVDDLALVHDPAYIRSIEKACDSGRRSLDMDTYIVPQSYRVGLLSAGGVITGLKMVMERGPKKTFVLNRPPGHHAERSRAMGFCLFNNVAVAANVARRDYGLKKVAIVDWDVHHGNGTQHTFEDKREVLFISTHQYPSYPGTGSLDEVGSGEGAGFTVNIPLPPGCGDDEYLEVFDQVIVPVIDLYQPELLIVSAGQDAHYRDHLAGMNLTERGYYNMASALASAADRWSEGRILLCLEGGYNLQGQAKAVTQVLSALGRWGLPVTGSSAGRESGSQFRRRLQQVVDIQRAFWDI